MRFIYQNIQCESEFAQAIREEWSSIGEHAVPQPYVSYLERNGWNEIVLRKNTPHAKYAGMIDHYNKAIELYSCNVSGAERLIVALHEIGHVVDFIEGNPQSKTKSLQGLDGLPVRPSRVSGFAEAYDADWEEVSMFAPEY